MVPIDYRLMAIMTIAVSNNSSQNSALAACALVQRRLGMMQMVSICWCVGDMRMGRYQLHEDQPVRAHAMAGVVPSISIVEGEHAPLPAAGTDPI